MSELIQNEVFSHDAYLCTLLARGDLTSPALATGLFGMPHDVIDISSVKTESVKHEVGLYFMALRIKIITRCVCYI